MTTLAGGGLAARGPRPGPREWGALVGFGAASAAVAWLGSMATLDNVRGWYAAAEKPGFTPPNWLFGPVWTLLYALIAVSAWLVWLRRREQGVGAALGWWAAQLALNLAWTPTFFALRWLWPAAVVIVALDAAVVVTMVKFWRVRRVAGALLVPYLAWIAFATALNVSIAALN